MKKNIQNYFYMFIIALAMGMTFTSCEDEYVASTLEGTWEGQMYAEYEWHGTWYETSRSEVCFNQDPFSYRSGTGYWVDYFQGRTPWRYNYIANHIKWSVKNGVIYIYFYEDDYELQIRDYSLNDRYFKGEVYASDGSWREFRLRHISSPNWNDYNWGYDYYDYPNGYDWGYDYGWYAKKSVFEDEDGNVITPEKPTRRIRGQE